MPGTRRPSFQQQNQQQAPAANRQRRDVGARPLRLVGDPLHLSQRPVRLDREAEELRNLTEHHGQRDAVHVAVADRLREKLGDEAETRETRPTQTTPDTIAIAPPKRDRARVAASRERQDDRQDDRPQAPSRDPARESGSDRTAAYASSGTIVA